MGAMGEAGQWSSGFVAANQNRYGMSAYFMELDFRPTPLGALSLRRRRDMTTGDDIFEIKLGDEFLMTSLFTASEIALADLCLSELSGGANLQVAVGGLGLGYTARAVLGHDTVGSLLVIEALDAVIEWHQNGTLPLGLELASDSRTSIVLGDFFALAASEGLDQEQPSRRFDAILVDIDHSPEHLLSERNAPFYRREGLMRLAAHLRSGGIFGLWSNDVPDEAFTSLLSQVFATARAERVTFFNPLQKRKATQTVYVAQIA
jgi:spermidine synthase